MCFLPLVTKLTILQPVNPGQGGTHPVEVHAEDAFARDAELAWLSTTCPLPLTP